MYSLRNMYPQAEILTNNIRHIEMWAPAIISCLLVVSVYCEVQWIDTMNDFVVDEELAVGTKVYTLRAIDTVTGSSDNIIYGFNNKENDNDLSLEDTSSNFRIDQETGEVFTYSSRLDYESDTDKRGGFNLNFLAKTRDNSEFSRQVSTITLRNLNDNAPKFRDAERVYVKESTTVPAGGRLLFKDITATDPDLLIYNSGNNAAVLRASIAGCTYSSDSRDNGTSLLSCNGTFQLKHTGFFSDKYVGDLFQVKPVDFEQYPLIVIKLEATDGQQVGVSEFAVVVENVQDLPPFWTILPFSTKTREHNINFRVKVEAVDGDLLGREVHYRIAPGQEVQGIPVESVFQIDPFEGNITNKVPLDLEDEQYFRSYNPDIIRDRWPIQLEACEISSRDPLVLTDQCAKNVTTVQLVDINDNAPQHVKTSEYEYYLFENEPNGRVLDTPSIEIFDRDTELYNTFFTEFINPSQEFSITGADRNPTISIKNTSLIDMDEGPREYSLLMRTYDINDPTLSSTSTVRIFLKDRNDNSPYFQRSSYTVSVREDVQAGFPVLTVTAFDKDFDTFNHGNNSIQYSLLGAYSELFSINPDSGFITVQECNGQPRHGVHPCIDFDIDPIEYKLEIRATDNNNGKVARSTNVPLTINVEKFNDNKPEVPNYSRDIREGRTTFQPELKIEGTDKDDRGGFSSLSYSILAQAPGTFWKVDPLSGVISVNKPNGVGIKYPDGDDGAFELEVAVTDGKYIAISKVSIQVLDENDNAPYFKESEYEFTINETTPGGTFIFKLEAFDPDDPSTKNGQIEFSIFSGNTGGKFTLDKTDGTLSVAPDAVFDYDKQNLYKLTAVVNDQGFPQLQGNTSITINILNANNKNPQVIPSYQPFVAYENWKVGTKVGTVLAVDPDIDAELRFEFVDPRRAFTSEGVEVLSSNYDFLTLFSLNASTGVITVNSNNLSSETTRDLTFRLKVSDITPTPIQSSSGTVVIEVLPFNDQPPVFQAFDSPIRIPEQSPGSIIISLIARDNNGIDSYEIIEQPDDFFIITKNTGSVSMRTSVDYDDARRTNDSYFIVRARDTGVPQLSATASVSVIFYNINDEYPYFVNPVDDNPQDIYFADIYENSPNGTDVTLVKALDSDRPDNNGFHLVRYSMEDSRFTVDQMTGYVTVQLQPGFVLDREQNSKILSLVLAKDNPFATDPDNQKQAAATIQVRLLDENDNPPIFSSNEYEVTIFESIFVDTVILQVFTTDLDLGDHAISVYTKVPNKGNDTLTDFFGVGPNSGRVFVQKSLYKKARIYPYVFYIQAQDNRGTGLTAEAKVTVYVKQSANTPPRFVIPARANMTINVLESQYNGMLVYDVKAVDDDSGNNGIVDYSFIYNGQTTQTTPEFEINPVNGMIHAQIVYDRERVDRYVLLLKASDRGTTPLESTRFLTVMVKDVNDNAPIFPLNEIEFRVQEDAIQGHFIGQVEATDADLDPIIIYEIISGNEDGVFQMGRTDGRLTLAKTLDSERKSVYYLDVQARNEEPDYTIIRSRRKRAIDPSIITIKVLVGDINDLAPVFIQSEYYGCVSTRDPFDKHIITIQAKDYDAIGTGIVRYRIASGNVENGQTLFDIDPKYGVLSNKVVMMPFADRIYTMRVNARDGEIIEESESANVTARVFVTMPGKEVKLLITQNTGEVRLYQSQIQSIIEETDDLKYLCINSIDEHVTQSPNSGPTLWSDVYVSGVREDPLTKQLSIISGVELRNIISREMSDRGPDFDLLYIKEVELASSSDEIELRDKAVLIIVIIIAVLIFLVIIFCIVAFMCIQAAKQQKKKILVHKTYATPVPVMVADPKPEPILYDNRAYVREVVSEPEPEPVVVSTMEEPRQVVQPETVHVQYAVVQKPGHQAVGMDEPDDQEAIVVELQNDEPNEADVYEPNYTIVAEVENQ